MAICGAVFRPFAKKLEGCDLSDGCPESASDFAMHPLWHIAGRGFAAEDEEVNHSSMKRSRARMSSSERLMW